MDRFIRHPKTQIENDKRTSYLLFFSIGIIVIGYLCVYIEIANNHVGDGLFISCIVVACGLSLYSLVILLSSRNITINNSVENNIIKILLTINSAINVGALVYFIVLFSTKSSQLMNLSVLEYINPYLSGFLYTIVVIVLVNIIIYHYLVAANLQLEDTIPTIIFLGLFGFIECMIEIIFLNIINRCLNNITDG
jgi:hypothetical protein